MYNLLIADDEEIIRLGLEAKINRQDPRIGQIYLAADGREALKVVREKHPDIIITDIRMPEVDGLLLIRQAKELLPNSKFIIISGYAEFDYAEQALELGASSYLLKPISEEKLNETIKRSMNELDRQQVKEHQQARRETQMWSLQLEQAANQMIHAAADDSSAGDRVRGLWCVDDASYMMALINIDGKTYFESAFQENSLDLLKYAISNVIYECFAKWSAAVRGGQAGKHVILNDYQNRKQMLLLLAHGSAEVLRYEPEILLNQARNLLFSQMAVSVTIGMSEPSHTLDNELYRQVTAAVQERLSHGAGKLYCYRNTTASLAMPEHKLGLLEKYIERYDISNIRVILDNIFQESYLQGQSAEYARFVWLRIVNTLVRMEASSGRDSSLNQVIGLLDASVLDKQDDIGAVKDTLCEIITAFLESRNVEPADASGKVDRALRYVDQHYDEDISINDLASLNGQMTPSYFSTIFKRETGRTVVSYLTEKRLMQACHLLQETSGSVIDIAEQVGYHDVQYFFRVFKKAVGCTPLEFRKGGGQEVNAAEI